MLKTAIINSNANKPLQPFMHTLTCMSLLINYFFCNRLSRFPCPACCIGGFGRDLPLLGIAIFMPGCKRLIFQAETGLIDYNFAVADNIVLSFDVFIVGSPANHCSSRLLLPDSGFILMRRVPRKRYFVQPGVNIEAGD
jgi:hypothetical protein